MQRLLEDALRVPALEERAALDGDEGEEQAKQRAQAVLQDAPGGENVGDLDQGE